MKGEARRSEPTRECSALTRRDLCAFDRICDHLIVIDHDFMNRFGQRKPKVVGCYRLLRQDVLRSGRGGGGQGRAGRRTR